MTIWDNGHKALAIGFGLAIVAIIILSLSYCNKQPPDHDCPEIKDSTITKTFYKWSDTTRVHWVDKPVPVPYFDTMYSPEILDLIRKGREAFAMGEDFDQNFILKYPANYIDTIRGDTIDVYYNAEIAGFMNWIKVGWRIHVPFSVTQTNIYEVDVSEPPRKPLRMLYMGFDIESDIDNLIYFEPELSLIVDKWEFSGGISIPSKPIRYKAGSKRLLFTTQK